MFSISMKTIDTSIQIEPIARLEIHKIHSSDDSNDSSSKVKQREMRAMCSSIPKWLKSVPKSTIFNKKMQKSFEWHTFF